VPLAVVSNLDLFHGEADWEDSAAAVTELLTGSLKRNVRYLRRHPEVPSPWAKRPDGRYLLTYRADHASEPYETFRSISEIIRPPDGGPPGSDCDGLSPYAVAWMIVRENDPGARIFIQWKRGMVPGTLTYHILQINGRGEVGDICRTLGMGRVQ
jgi:hypothetical protein